MTTSAATAPRATRVPAVAIVAGAIAAAAVVNLLLFALGSAAGGAMAVEWPSAMPIAAFMPVVATLVPLAAAAVVVWAIARRSPAFLRFAAWAGATVAVLSVVAPLIGGVDLATKLSLAPMHLVAGAAWVLVVRALSRPRRS
jgi:hypothetical protein